MMMNVASTAIGSMLAITIEALRLSTSTMITITQINISWEGGLQRPDRLLDKPRTVVERHDGYLGDRPVRQYLLG